MDWHHWHKNLLTDLSVFQKHCLHTCRMKGMTWKRTGTPKKKQDTCRRASREPEKGQHDVLGLCWEMACTLPLSAQNPSCQEVWFLDDPWRLWCWHTCAERTRMGCVVRDGGGAFILQGYAYKRWINRNSISWPKLATGWGSARQKRLNYILFLLLFHFTKLQKSRQHFVSKKQ